tara:strand:+ start:3773 stop:4027 length:255 start_codon:yes stop_codon:yes gene_type:complete
MKINPLRKQFEAGHSYKVRSPCDSGLDLTVQIIRRTAKTVWFEVQGDIYSRRITPAEQWGAEWFYPFGKYSMAMHTSADDEVGA